MGRERRSIDGRFFVVLFLAIFCFWLLRGGGSQAAAQNPAGSRGEDLTHLRGTVINRATHEPIARALVLSNDNRFATMTDDRGRFDFALPPAQTQVSSSPSDSGPIALTEGTAIHFNGGNRPYSLSARKPGFLVGHEGQDQTSIGPTQQQVTVYLEPEARVIGHVIVPNSDGSDRIRVALYRRQMQGGPPRWVSVGQEVARQDGGFRFADLPTGFYKLFTLEFVDRDPLIFDPRGQLFGYPPVYYPASADFDSAELIHLLAGETFQATLSPERREYYRVRMSLTDRTAQPQVEVWPQGRPGPGYELGYDGRDGSIRGLLPNGTYNIRLTNYAPESNLMTATASITVAGAPVAGGRIAFVQGVSIAVSVTEEFQHKPQTTSVTTLENGSSFNDHPSRPSYLRLVLMPDEEFGERQEVQMRNPKGPDDTSFGFDNVPPGPYRVRVDSGFGFVSSISSGGTDLLRETLVVGAGTTPPPIEITMRDDAAEVEGTVENATEDQPAGSPGSANSSVSAVPTARAIYFLPAEGGGGHFTQVWIAPNGTFQVQVPPGSYRVLAFDRQQTDLENATGETGHEYDSRARNVTLAPGQKEHLRLRVISTEE